MKQVGLCLIFFPLFLQAQMPDHIYKPNIKTVTLTQSGNIYSYPVIALNSGEQLDLHFDDLDGDVKNYYYSYQLCNADWTPSTLFSFDYIRGFQNVRITTYRNSSIAVTRYTHYQAVLPDRNCIPTRSGNYLLKVFLDADTSKLVFTKRFLVVEMKASIAAQVQQPFNATRFRTFQKLQIGVTLNSNIHVFNQQDIKVVAIQNFSWPTAKYLGRPDIFRGNYFEYYDEESTSFQAGKEWRWLDMRSLRFQSDRILKLEKKAQTTDVYVRPDGNRQQQPYVYYRDYDGLFGIETVDNVNPYWQGDYAYVHFSFLPPGNRPFEGKNIYVYGALTNYTPDENSKMVFNPERGAYEKTLFLKQGYYNYSYITVPERKEEEENLFFENTEGNFWGTENTYMVLVYYRSFGSRADELIGYTTVSSLFQRPGF
ncbi:MAG: DUF5103 domain-containing protein [Chitinophagaceae bacterium]